LNVPPWSPWSKHEACSVASSAASGTPPADALAERHDVGFDPGVFVGEQLSGPAHAGLDLVDDQQQAALLGQRPQFLQEFIGRRPHAGFALDRLQHHGDCRRRDQPPHRPDVV